MDDLAALLAKPYLPSGSAVGGDGDAVTAAARGEDGQPVSTTGGRTSNPAPTARLAPASARAARARDAAAPPSTMRATRVSLASFFAPGDGNSMRDATRQGTAARPRPYRDARDGRRGERRDGDAEKPTTSSMSDHQRLSRSGSQSM